MYDPETYQKNKSIPDTLNTKEVPKLFDAMTWDFSLGNILDYGCGPGSTGFKQILPKAELTDSQLYSIDISPEMVEFSKKNFPHPRIHYAVGSIPENFPFTDIKFDRIMSVNVFHFIPNPNKVLTGIWGILKPGGEIGLTFVTNSCASMRMWKEIAKLSKWAPYMQNVDNFWPAWTNWKVPESNHDAECHFKRVFVECGVEWEIRLFDFKVVRLTPDTDAYIDIMVGANPCLPAFPKELITELKKVYRETFTKLIGVPADSETVFDDIEYISAVLRKPL